MSLYNMLNGMNAELAITLSPFLPRRADRFPRFRDIFIDRETNLISVYTRVGGGNRGCWNDTENENCGCGGCDADRLEDDPNCTSREDDSFDSTYCTFTFKIPESMKEDLVALAEARISSLSQTYKTKLREQFPEDPATPKTNLIVKMLLSEVDQEK